MVSYDAAYGEYARNSENVCHEHVSVRKFSLSRGANDLNAGDSASSRTPISIGLFVIPQ